MANFAIFNDQHVFSGISTYVYGIFNNIVSNGINSDFYQFIMYNDNIPIKPQNVKRGVFNSISANSKLVYNSKLALNFLTGYNWKTFKHIKVETALLSGPTLLPLVRYFKHTIVVGHDLYFITQSGWNPILARYMRKMYDQFNQADYLILNSNYSKKEFSDNLNILNEKMRVVYPSFDPTIFYPGKNTLRKSLNIHNNDKILLSVGGDNPNKNIETIFRVLKNLPDNFKLIRVGRNFNTEKLLNDYGIKNRTILLGNVNQKTLSDLYKCSDVFVFPSLFEGFGIPLIEAMASGTPVITSNRGSLPEVVGDAGFICDPFDVDFITNAITELTEENKIREEYIRKGLKRSQLFTPKAQFESLIKVPGIK